MNVIDERRMEEDTVEIRYKPNYTIRISSDSASFVEGHRFRCERGHEWFGEIHEVSVATDPSYRSGPLCPYCIIDWYRRNFPTSIVER